MKRQPLYSMNELATAFDESLERVHTATRVLNIELKTIRQMIFEENKKNGVTRTINDPRNDCSNKLFVTKTQAIKIGMYLRNNKK